ncbi:ABC transporter substrate-binding protein [Paenibacillus sp. 1P07SE]|uniref:ABC transporter substrate-binding protein n=1 Tax=Paenibacillus sp. 1P07SE TaxID=3132209 RepID=UPI0039A5DC61
MVRTKQGIAAAMTASLLLLSACGAGTTTNDNTGGAASPGTNGEASASAEPVTIEFWYGLGGNLGDNMKALIDKFNASQNEVIVKGVVQGDYTETEQKLQAAIATSNVPAAVLASNHDWARRGYYASLDELIAQDPDFQADDFVPAFLEQGKVDGEQFFLPMYGTTQVMYYRKDALEKIGVKPEELTTWEALAEAAERMTVKENGKTVFYGWEPMWGSGNMIDAALSRGGTILSEDGKTVMIDSPEWIETWDAFRKWIHEDQIMRIHHGGQGWEYWYKTIDDVMKNRAAGYTGSSGDQGDLDFEQLGAMVQPGWEGVGEGKPVASALLAGIPAKASDEQQQAAFKWLTFFNSSENTAWWSMNTGYIAVRESALEDPDFKAYSEANPHSRVPLMQASQASLPFTDPTGGKINDALTIAVDKVQIENIPAETALREAKQTAQAALDQVK